MGRTPWGTRAGCVNAFTTSTSAGAVAADPPLFDDVHGAGWRLVTATAGPADLAPDLVAWFESIGGAVVVLDATGTPYEGWFARRGVTWALQRPDFVLSGTATGSVGGSDLLADLRDHLHRPSTLHHPTGSST